MKSNAERTPWVLKLTLIASFVALAPNAFADTVYLRNGAAIDGIVTGRHEGNLILSIGNVGTIKIPEETIERVEKNARTGYLEPSKRADIVKKLPEIEDPEAAVDGEKGDEGESSDSSGTEEAEGVEIDPELEQRIDQLCHELTRQRTRNRVRAERQLAELGDVAIPKLIKLHNHAFVRTRAAVFRLLKNSKDFRVAEPAVNGLSDEDRFVRKLAWETLKNVSGRDVSFPWDGPESARKKEVKKWRSWYEQEKKRLEEEAKKAEEEAAKKN